MSIESLCIDTDIIPIVSLKDMFSMRLGQTKLLLRSMLNQTIKSNLTYYLVTGG